MSPKRKRPPKLFIGYGSSEDCKLALQLQALLVAHGLFVYVPPEFAALHCVKPLVGRMIRYCDMAVFLAPGCMSPICEQQFRHACRSSGDVVRIRLQIPGGYYIPEKGWRNAALSDDQKITVLDLAVDLLRLREALEVGSAHAD